MRFLAEKIDKSDKPLNSLEIVDHVIAIQLAKIEKTNVNTLSKASNENNEEAMKNLIDLLKLRQEIIN